MENWVFYWLAWLLWIIVYFFEKDHVKRFYYSSGVLMLIIISNMYFISLGIMIYWPLLPNLLLGMFLLSRTKQKLVPMCLTISLSFGYSGLQIWEKLNPLWLFISSSILVVAVSSLLLFIFIDELKDRIAVWMVSTSFGQLLFGLVRKSYGFQETIGDYTYLIDLVLMILLLTTVYKIRQFSEKVEQALRNARVKLKV
ncbi:YphA family membrane protein [Salinibacillus xinjiangensis]|uniref:Uncharacterized protein n=1 Tax=Salinibacillus xinjiangensis TaxID=1229268 RepID=A0A6G1X685_9BACI|nr:hypothetical protein [Salinibacillus xinjiangensis]MRG86416.1 hypothetical protein [Salinibacillus xinjiangensis]